MMRFFCLLLALPSLVAGWSLSNFSDLVIFGNSYADESRWAYFVNHDGSAPPVGWDEPVSNTTRTGGYIWPRFVANHTGTNLSNYAVSGAACSNSITPRIDPQTGILHPSVLEYEIPAFLADYKLHGIPQDSAVYAIWIGTNDLGYEGFLTDSQARNATVTTYVDCIYHALDTVYATGGRQFVLMNLAPLHLAPLYAVPENGGVSGEDSSYWSWKPENITGVSYRMKEQVVALNQVFSYRTPYELFIARRYPGASFAVMDMYGLLSDIYYYPTDYPEIRNVTGYVNQCEKGANCQRQPHPEQYLWFDELHPSEQTDRIIADQFIQVVEGKSRWASYW